jgi:hypothetical protein
VSGQDPLDFLIVGTPRSGTTLVQRLASELPGVAVPPETHFFWRFLPPLLDRRRFPLHRAALADEVRAFTAMDTSRGLRLDVDRVVDRLGGSCRSPLGLFLAIVAELAGPAAAVGEKTPEHLAWWRPLTRALPRLQLVAVVRDPRAVAGSHARVPWGIRSPVHLGEQWRIDQREVLRARRTLGHDRVLVLRYEDVVADPDAARERLAAFLAPPSPPPAADPSGGDPIVLPWEWWKHRALEPVTDRRVAAWRESLEPGEAADVAACCRGAMRRLGYPAPSRVEAAGRMVRWAPGRHLGRVRFRRRKLRRLRAIRGSSLGAEAVPRQPLVPGSSVRRS